MPAILSDPRPALIGFSRDLLGGLAVVAFSVRMNTGGEIWVFRRFGFAVVVGFAVALVALGQARDPDAGDAPAVHLHHAQLVALDLRLDLLAVVVEEDVA